MCTPNYIRSDSPVTDLSFYSLRLNTNIPTTYATTRPFGFQPFSPGPSFFPQKRAPVSSAAAARAASEAVRSLQRNVPPPAMRFRPHEFQPPDAFPSSSSVTTSAPTSSERSFGSDSSESLGGHPFFRAHGIRLPRLKSVSSAMGSRSTSVGACVGAGISADSPAPAGAKLSGAAAISHEASIGLPSSISYPHSRLDLLVQTATASSGSLEPMLPPFLGYKGPAGYPAQVPRPPSLCSSRSSSSSIPPAPRTPTGAHSAHLGPSRNLIDDSAMYVKESLPEQFEHARHHAHLHTHMHAHADGRRNGADGADRAAGKKRSHESLNDSSSSSPIAIKLASPSTSTKRQRSGPSCDCCRSRKIKCDSEIVILAHLPDGISDKAADGSRKSQIAHCEWIAADADTGYQYFRIVRPTDWEAAPSSSRRAKLGTFNYLKFKPCKACNSKNLDCKFTKGFTRNDIIKFNKCQRERRGSLERSASCSSERNLAQMADDSRRPAADSARSRRSSSAHGSRASKKTSCRVCRVKKIKCIKIDGSSSCLNCTRKLLQCSYD